MEPEEQRRLEAHFQGLSDGELRRITTLEREQYRDDAFGIAMDELARRHLPVLRPEEYWARFREEWLAQVGFCYQCWATTTDESLGARLSQKLIGTRVVAQVGQDPCPFCQSVVATKCFCIVIPIVRQARYRVLFDRSLFANPPKGRRLRESRPTSESVGP